MALAEARLVTAKLLWHFDIELDGEHSTWVEDARFYVSASLIRGGFMAISTGVLAVTLKSNDYQNVRDMTNHEADSMAASAPQDQADPNSEMTQTQPLRRQHRREV